jgi:hypothetical protein
VEGLGAETPQEGSQTQRWEKIILISKTKKP